MKHLGTYINERIKDEYLYHPKTKEELWDAIKTELKAQGNNADLNCVDTSEITDMGWLFADSDFDGDISGWDVSSVTTMFGMFCNTPFNGDISGWDVSNVKNMEEMFRDSKFSQDISNWDVKNVTNMYHMFFKSSLKGKEPKWYKR